MKIRKLFKDLPCEIKGSKEEEISGIAIHSKEVYPGNLFIAGSGSHYEGAEFIEEAILGGASAILTDLYNPSLKSVVQIITKNPRSLEKEIALRFYENPSDSLFMVGITGTNGKTTCSFYIHYLLEKVFGSTGLIGTLEYVIGNKRRDASKTTPEASILQKLLHEMKENGCKGAVMEVSSHGLDQERVYGIEYDVALFTNLTQDHLDYHTTMEKYLEAKKKLFLGMSETKNKKGIKAIVLNRDSPFFESFLEVCQVPVFTYGFSEEADLLIKEVKPGLQRTEVLFSYRGEDQKVHLPSIGIFNVYNAMGSLLAVLTQGYSLDLLTPLLETLPQVPGRLEKIENRLGLSVFVDFCHTEDSLLNVLSTLKELNPKKIIVVFGCGGDRDKGKRVKMGACVEKMGAYALVTSDNPRSENPEEITNEIKRGFSSDYAHEVILDRKEAIAKGVSLVEKGDILLIAGRGAEKYQIIGNRMIPFLDRDVVFNELKNRELLCPSY